MKLIAIIQEEIKPNDDFLIVKFRADKSTQHFQVFVPAPYKKGFKKLDQCLLDIKFRSIVMKDLEGNKTYDTQLYSDLVLEATVMMKKSYK